MVQQSRLATARLTDVPHRTTLNQRHARSEAQPADKSSALTHSRLGHVAGHVTHRRLGHVARALRYMPRGRRRKTRAMAPTC